MLKLDFQTAVAIACLILIIILIPLRGLLFQGRKARDEWNPSDHVERCLYCGYVFLDYFRKRPLKCPQCQSYLEDGNVHSKKEK